MNEKRVETQPQEEDVPGHKPLEYRDGQFINSEGRPVKTNFSLGPEDRQKQVYIEYERTFGRGIAFNVTHGMMDAPKGVDTGKARQDYRELINLAQFAMHNGTEEQCREAISKLDQYRSKYTELYSDVQKEGPPKKFEIKKEAK